MLGHLKIDYKKKRTVFPNQNHGSFHYPLLRPQHQNTQIQSVLTEQKTHILLQFLNNSYIKGN